MQCYGLICSELECDDCESCPGREACEVKEYMDRLKKECEEYHSQTATWKNRAERAESEVEYLLKKVNFDQGLRNFTGVNNDR